MSTIVRKQARLLILGVVVAALPGVSMAGPATQTAQDQAATTTERPRATVDAAASAEQAAASVATTSVTPPSWMAASKGIGLRLRPNIGLRLKSLVPITPSIAPEDALGGTTPPWSIRAELTTLDINRERQSAKFQEFRDLRDSATGGVEAHYRSGLRSLNLVARNLGLRDEDLAIDGGKAGKFLISVGHSETPHNYSFDARSLYDGIGSGRLTISDRIQADLQSSTTTQIAADRIRDYQQQSAQTTEIGLLRKRIGIDLALLSTYPLTISLAASNESRDGVRPSMGTFGFGNFEELPWPIAVDTRDVRLSVEYARPESKFYGSGTFRASAFENHAPTLLFDNPYRIDDKSPGGGGTGTGAPSGLIQMPPSNNYEEATLMTVISRLPRQTSFSGVFSLGFMRQNEPLLPFTTNTTLTLPSGLNGADPAARPRATAEAAMNTSSAQIRLSTQPASSLRLVASYRYYDLSNQETPFTIPAFISVDASVRRPVTAGGTFAPVLAAYNRHTFTAEGNVDLATNTRVGLTYTFERMNRKFREVAWMNDQKVKFSFDTRPASRLDLKASYERSSRDTADYIFNQYNVVQGNPLESPVLPFLRKYDEAARKRDDFQLIATFMATDSLSLSGMALYGKDDFFKSPFGLLDDTHKVYSLDASYNLTEQFSMYGSYTFEHFDSFQKARQWSPAGVSNPYLRETALESNSNWEGRARDNTTTASAGLEALLAKKKLHLNVAFSYSKTDGSIGLASPVGVAANDVNAFEPAAFPAVDDVKFYTVNPELEYRVAERLALSSGYLFEKFLIDDTNYRGFTYTPRNLTEGLNAGLLMGSYLFPPYNVSVFYVRAKVGF